MLVERKLFAATTWVFAKAHMRNAQAAVARVTTN
jgi:hypothetical protein